MELILFTFPKDYVKEIELLNLFLGDKSLTVHIRKPSFSEDDLRFFLNNINKEFHPQLVIHNHLYLLKEYNLKGFHCTRLFLSKSKLIFEDLIKEYPNKTFSKTCHSLKELENTNERYSYVFLSPIFDSISKDNYPSAFNLKEVGKLLEKTIIKVVALGGISTSNLKQIKDYNFYGTGLLGSVWNSENPRLDYQRIKELL